ncbi:hypothetical protein BT93_L0426 [Corymbia citriodora subsp. variegata]|uniref:Polysaccharide biosynthesis domain-containing protein n=1 Tax=Corymbia citriodora subsp. variegata TaxID=360336 RepID=A0A8T0CU26_CORYI|nr:hypothetical protein BT93_L0426 [Corymbia citriodora subsp. variegata]
MNSTRLILLHPIIQKQSSSSNTNRLWLIFIITFFSTAFTLTLITITATTTTPTPTATSTAVGSAASSVPLPLSISAALLHYATTTTSTHLTSIELATITAAVTRCAAAATSGCNLLVFGLTHEALLYRTLNFDGRTIFLDENENLVSRFEQQHPGIEAYDVQYETRVGEMKRLLESARGEFRNECWPVQKLLFSECKLALNSLPNHVYELSWDVILIDGPSGYHEAAPGRMSTVFTAAVLARSKKGGVAKTRRVYSDEFLCRDNLVEVVGKLGHFVVERASDERLMTEFCRISASANSSSSVNINGVIEG